MQSRAIKDSVWLASAKNLAMMEIQASSLHFYTDGNWVVARNTNIQIALAS